jgi:sulfur transfer complex TusBCD TusB component (DsrH family)
LRADNDSLQMLTRNSQVGEFYVMAPPQVKPKGESGQHTCDIMIFDEERDAHVRIGWREALKATLCAEKDEAFLTKHGATTKMAGGGYLKDWAEEANKWAIYNDAATTNAYEGLNKDVRIIVARPFIEHAMHNVIMTVAGRDTGATLFGPADMQLSVS